MKTLHYWIILGLMTNGLNACACEKRLPKDPFPEPDEIIEEENSHMEQNKDIDSKKT